MQVTRMHIQSMAAAIEFVEQNLKRDITVTDMADAANYSLYHFCRVFNQVTHHTPYDYLMQRRLSAAALELLESKRRITDIAVDYTFNNPETFSRAFKHLFATQPSQWRKLDQPASRKLMPRLTQAHLHHRSQGGLSKPAVEQREPLCLVGLMTVVPADRQGIAGLWRMLLQELAQQKPGESYGLSIYPEIRETTGHLYLAAVKAHSLPSIPPTLVSKEIPAGDFVTVTHHGPPAELYLTLDYLLHTWLPKSGRSFSQHMVVEHYRKGWNQAKPITLFLPLMPAGQHPADQQT